MSDVSAAARPSEDDPKVHNRGSEEPWPDAESGGKGGKKGNDTESTAAQEPTEDPIGRDLDDGPS